MNCGGDAKLESINSSLPINVDLPESAYLDPEEYAQLSLQKILDKLDSIQDSINSKTVNQTVFFRQRHGLGFSEGSNSNELKASEAEKLRRELIEKNENLSISLQTFKDKTEFLFEKIKVLESKPKGEQTWFGGQNAHSMYVNQAQGSKGKQIDFAQRKQERPFRPWKGKYGYVTYNRVCWHYGKNGQYDNECPHRQYQRRNS